MPGVLVYGFGPYLDYRHNITERTLRALAASFPAHRRVFDVAFDRAMFERVLERIRPAVVIGTGQHPRAKKLRLERLARRGPARLPVTLHLPRRAHAAPSWDAGRYVCNFSMWVVARWCARRGARFAFIHVPADFPAARLARYLEDCVRRRRTGGAARSSRRGPARSR